MAEAVTIVRSLHILFALLWAGGALFFSSVVWPLLLGDEQARRAYFHKARHGPFMGLTALGTVGFGLATYIMRGADAYSSGENAVLGIGMLAGVVGLLVGFAGHLPTGRKIIRAIDAEDEPTLVRLEQREGRLQIVSVIAVAVAVASMIVFRWFA